jgi:hypothetical protein
MHAWRNSGQCCIGLSGVEEDDASLQRCRITLGSEG